MGPWFIVVSMRGKRVTLGNVGILTPAQARDRAREILADVVRGNHPVNKKRNKVFTLKEFVEIEYAPWRRANRKRADEDIYRVNKKFGQDFGHELLSDITPLLIDR